MTPPPDATAHQALAACLHQLTQSLPRHYATLLAAPEFARGQAALDDLNAPGRIDAAVAEFGAEEAVWLCEKLQCYWDRIAPPERIEPSLTLRPVPTVWYAGDTARIALRAQVTGLAEGWQAIWPETAEPGPEQGQATLTLAADAAQDQEVSLRVIGKASHPRAEGEAVERTILIATQEITCRRAMYHLSQDRKTLRVFAPDQTLAAHLRLEIDGQTVTLDSDGHCTFDTALDSPCRIMLDGVPVPKAGG